MRRILNRLLRPLWRSRALGLSAEIYFWWRWIGSRGLEWREEFERRLDPNQPLLPHVAAYVRGIPLDTIRILDVGAGPITVLGYRVEGKRIEITAVDVLANVYERLLSRQAIVPPVRTTYADAERLSQWFAPASFDFVYAQNCLDHAARPNVAIDEMVKVTKPGRYILLAHAADEAVREHYVGLHQWNFSERNGDFVIWNPMESINISAGLRPACAVRTERRGNSIVVEIQKLGSDSSLAGIPDGATLVGA